MARRTEILRALTAAVPALLLAPYLSTPVPRSFHFHREIAGYYQALAYRVDPIGQFFYNTPAENLSSVHFHSLLSAPLVGLGFPQGGRLVSLAMAVAAALLVGWLGARLVSPVAGAVAAALLWSHPLYVELAASFMPETTSVALTTGALAALWRAYESGADETVWKVVCCLAVVLAVATHLWEALILLPLATLAVLRRDRTFAAVVTVVGFGAAGLFYWVTALQPAGGESLVDRYAFFVDPSVFLSADEFWLAFADEGLFGPALTATFVLSVAIALGLLALAAFRGAGRELLLASWLLAGLSIPFLLANGLRIHEYYLWATLPPLAVAGAWLLSWAAAELARRLSVDGDRATAAVAVSALVLSGALIGVVHLGAVSTGHVSDPVGGLSQEQIRETGSRLDGYDPDRVVFAGDWGYDVSHHYGQFPAMSGIMIQNGWFVTSRTPLDGDGPRFAPNGTAGEPCDALVWRNGSDVTVRDC